MMRPIILGSVVLMVFLASPPLWAGWPNNGNPVCTEASDQYSSVLAPDGAGGVIIAWYDSRNADGDIYAQRVSASGEILWATNGVPVCLAAGIQNMVGIAADGTGGAFIAWLDLRNGNGDIYAQHLDSTGAATWLADGVAVCVALGEQGEPDLIADGAGGVILTWRDGRGGDNDIYVQKLDGSGAEVWDPNGVALCNLTGDQWDPRIITDGGNGAIVAWYDQRGGDSDIYAQRIKSTGWLAWQVNGIPLCSAAQDQFFVELIPDGAGGAVAAWCDNRGGAESHLYAQRVTTAGDIMWPIDGVELCTAPGDQRYHSLTTDGAGGAIVSWSDRRSFDYDIYAQRIDGSGTILWNPQGIAVRTATGSQLYPVAVADGEGGAFIVWDDSVDYLYDSHVQRIDGNGALAWPLGGIDVNSAVGNELGNATIPDGAGGIITTWIDFRSGNGDVYVQQVDSEGRIGYFPPVIHAVTDVPGDQGGYVNVAWDAPILDYESGDITEYTLWRAMAPSSALSILEAGGVLVADPARAAAFAKAGGESVLLLTENGEKGYYWELAATQAAYRLTGYALTTPALFDSTAVCTDLHYYQVIAHTGDPGVFYVSEPDSGYSVDNLGPAAPTGLAGAATYSPTSIRISWTPNGEPDLDYYRIYRGKDPGFVPGPGTLVAALADTVFVDKAWTGTEYFKVSALDIHGNESPFALLVPDQVSGVVAPALPVANYLDQNSPNPFNPETTLVFGLARDSRVTVAVYDLGGRLVRTLARGFYPAGRHSVRWDGRDDVGRAVASAVYLARLQTEAGSLTRRMTLMK